MAASQWAQSWSPLWRHQLHQTCNISHWRCQMWNLHLSLTVVSQWKARFSTEHGIYIYIFMYAYLYYIYIILFLTFVSHISLNTGKNSDPFGNGNAQLSRKKRSSSIPQLQWPLWTANSYRGVWDPTTTMSSLLSISLSIAEAGPFNVSGFSACAITLSQRPG